MVPAPMAQNGQPSPYAQVGLGDQFIPGSITFRVLAGADAEGRAVVVVFETAGGVFGITLRPEHAKVLADQIREKATGIIMPPAGGIPPGVPGGPGG